ncbi:MAG: cupin domain-containing protein [Candidatus Thorarchaeota archaeon]
MKHVHESEIERVTVQGERGYVHIWDAVREPLVAGIREVAPNSEVPARTHVHPEAQIIYVITGRPKITNLHETIQLRPGDFVILESDEEHYVITEDEPSRIFEVKYRS